MDVSSTEMLRTFDHAIREGTADKRKLEGMVTGRHVVVQYTYQVHYPLLVRSCDATPFLKHIPVESLNMQGLD